MPVINVKNYVGEARAAAATLAAAHASLTLAGELGDKQNGYIFDGASVKKETIDTTGFEYVLATSYAAGGSYCVVV